MFTFQSSEGLFFCFFLNVSIGIFNLRPPFIIKKVPIFGFFWLLFVAGIDLVGIQTIHKVHRYLTFKL